MNILDIIEKKRDAKELNKEEIEFFVKGYTDGSIPDYQAAALVNFKTSCSLICLLGSY